MQEMLQQYIFYKYNMQLATCTITCLQIAKALAEVVSVIKLLAWEKDTCIAIVIIIYVSLYSF